MSLFADKVDLFMDSGALFSPCGKYRPLLWRIWDNRKPLLMLLMLNPSRAGAKLNDPTVTRQIERAHQLGCGGLLVGNLFDFIATDPVYMKFQKIPSSEWNDAHLLEMARRTVASGGKIICAWGKDGTHRNRAAEVLGLLSRFPLYALKINGDGQPGHPLYLAYSVQPFLFREAQ